MPKLTKPCEGMLSELTQNLLRTSRGRAKWGIHPCQVCGRAVGVLLLKGNWVPEVHWPSVTYKPRKELGSQSLRSSKEPLQQS